MKKFLSLFLCLTCILTLVACGKKAAPITLPQADKITSIAAIAGFFIGATLDEAMGGAILFSMIAGIACIVYNIENREE